MDAKSISVDALDNARNTGNIAATNLRVTERQYALTKAGAWVYDIENPSATIRRFESPLSRRRAAGQVHLARTKRRGRPRRAFQVGSYVSPQGAYDSYTKGLARYWSWGCRSLTCRYAPISMKSWCMSCQSRRIKAEMFVRGTNDHVALTFVRIQPLISPKIELSDERQERVDLRVLPVIFRFERPHGLRLYPGNWWTSMSALSSVGVTPRSGWCVVLLATLSGCAVGPNFTPLPVSPSNTLQPWRDPR